MGSTDNFQPNWVSQEDNARKVAASHVAARWVRFEVADEVIAEFRQN